MSALQEEPEVEVVDQDAVEFVDVTSKKPAPVRADMVRFDFLADLNKYDESKLCADVVKNLQETSGQRYWYASVDDADGATIGGEHPYEKYAKDDVAARCLLVWLSGGVEVTSANTLMIREAALAGIARQPRESVWTNGMGDMFVDTGVEDVDYTEVHHHSSVVLETGSVLTIGTAKKITYLRFTISMPDNSSITSWGDVERKIVDQAHKVGWKKHDHNYNHSGRFDGSMYKWYITLQFAGDKPKPTAEVITPVWEACLTGVNNYRLENPDSVIICHLGTGSMEIGDQKWDIMTPPPILYVGD